MTCRIERPDTRQHLTACAEPTEENACVKRGVHTCLVGGRTKLEPFVVPESRWGSRLLELIYHTKTEYDPLEVYLNSLPPHEGPSIIDAMLVECFGAEGNELNRAAARLILLGVVQRTFDPGSKMDIVVTLIGPQGSGKSSMCRALLPSEDMFSDSFYWDANPERQGEALQGKAIVEVPEMTGLRRSERNKVKSLITRQTDEWRRAFRRNPEPLPRRCLFVGTSNENDILPNDPTGNRRFLAVECPAGTRAKVVAWVEAHRDALWSEAVSLYRAGERAFLPDQLLEAQKQRNEEHRGRDDFLEEQLRTVPGTAGMTMKDIYNAAGLTTKEYSYQKMMQALNALGWRKKGGKNSKWISPPNWEDEM